MWTLFILWKRYGIFPHAIYTNELINCRRDLRCDCKKIEAILIHQITPQWKSNIICWSPRESVSINWKPTVETAYWSLSINPIPWPHLWLNGVRQNRNKGFSWSKTSYTKNKELTSTSSTMNLYAQSDNTCGNCWRIHELNKTSNKNDVMHTKILYINLIV